MTKTILFCFFIAFSNGLFARVLLPEDESRSLDEATAVVEKSKKDRKDFDSDKSKREMASEKENDPKFQKAFEKLMKDLDQK
jgi:hypothetical protein